MTLRFLCLFVTLTITGYAGNTTSLRRMGQANVGKPLPFLSGFDLATGAPTNSDIVLADHKSTHLFVFFQTTCSNCLVGMRELSTQDIRLKAAGIDVVLVDIQESPETIRPWLAVNKLSGYRTFVDTYGTAAGSPMGLIQDGVVRLPASVLVNAKGIVRRLFTTEGPDWIDQIIKTRTAAARKK